MEKLIAVVDDEEDLAELVEVNLVKEGFKVKKYYDGKSFLKSLTRSKPDLVLLDIMMPETDGITVCRQMKADKQYSNIPVIFLTARSAETDKVLGLEFGADDYITKPFSVRELAARVKAVLRRSGKKTDDNKTRISGIVIDTEKHQVLVKGNDADLTATEFRILQLLVSKPGNVFSREQLLDNLWGNEKAVVDRTIDVHIKHLREKLGKAGNMIKNIRGVGYKIEQ